MTALINMLKSDLLNVRKRQELAVSSRQYLSDMRLYSAIVERLVHLGCDADSVIHETERAFEVSNAPNFAE